MEEENQTPEAVVEVAVDEAEPVLAIGERYLRRRPFLVVNSALVPNKKAVAAGKKGAPLQRVERPYVVDSVSKKHMTEAEVIIDVLNRTIVKSRFGNVATGEQIVESYLGKYAEIVAEGVMIWARQRGMAEGL